MSNKIEIRIDGDTLTPDTFLEGARQFFALVEGVAKSVTGKKLDWTVEVDKGSAVVRLIPAVTPNEDHQRSIRTVQEGIRALRNGTRIVPPGFTNATVIAAKALASLVNGKDVRGMSIQNGGATPEDIPHDMVHTVDVILEGQPKVAFGSVEGRILSLSAKHGRVCVIDDPIQRREITCYLQSDQAQKKAYEGYEQRVIAIGLIHYTKEGYTTSITVDEIRIFPPDSQLPALADIQAIYKSYK